MALSNLELQALAVCADPEASVDQAQADGVALLRSRGLINSRREVTGKGLCFVALHGLAPRGNLARVRRGRPDPPITGRTWYSIK